MISIMLVDDHKMIREGIKRIIEFDETYKVIYSVGNGKEAISTLDSEDVCPDIIILDVHMPEMDGLETLRAIQRRELPTKVLMLTASADVNFLVEAMDIGICGYILKTSDYDELLRAIEYVYDGKRFIQPSLIPLLNAKLIARDLDADKQNSLSEREIDVLRFVANGYSNIEIAMKLEISESTIKNHLSSIFKKLDCTDRTQAAIFAIRNNLVSIQ